MMGESVAQLTSLENPVFRAFLFYVSILALKVLFMVPLTARLRFSKKIFISSEDTKILKGAKSGVADPDIERVRNAHRNDMENVFTFIFVAYPYLLTNPNPSFAIMLMRLFTIARIVHTFVYAVVVIPQPTRAIAFFVGFFITIYMAVISAVTFAS